MVQQPATPIAYPICIATPIINDHSKREGCGQYHAPAVLPPEKTTVAHGIVCLDPRAGMEIFGKVKKKFASAEIQTLGRPVCNLVAIPDCVIDPSVKIRL